MPISKLDAAQRQLDTAIDLWFRDRDGLAVFTLAYAGFRILFDVSRKTTSEGFDVALDKLLGESGWQSITGLANFLKHADRDPNAVLDEFHPDLGMPVIGLATLLYKRLTGTLSLKMQALDCWIEIIGADELGIEETDSNPERAAANKRIREELRRSPRDQFMQYALRHYEFFLGHRENLSMAVDDALARGESLQEILDRELQDAPKGIDPH